MTDEPDEPQAISLEALLTLLQDGELAIQGLLPEGSNYTFLSVVSDEDRETYAVYKPTRGEQPLWDFPEATLAYREVAAFVVSEALGWRFVPPTVYRTEGPHGPGSLQFFVHIEPDCHYFSLSPEDKAEHLPRMFEFMFTTKPDGHGFGLSTSHRTIENHGGRFGVESPPGSGAQFTVSLPLQGPGGWR